MIAALRDLIFRDFWLKLFSFVVAVLIWFIVNIALKNEGSPGSITSLSLVPPEQRVFANLPVVILSSAEDVRSVHVSPKEVEVTVQGDPKLLKTLKAEDIRVLLDLTGIGAAHDLRKRIEVSTPPGISHVRIYPEEVQVIFPPKG